MGRSEVRLSKFFSRLAAVVAEECDYIFVTELNSSIESFEVRAPGSLPSTGYFPHWLILRRAVTHTKAPVAAGPKLSSACPPPPQPPPGPDDIGLVSPILVIVASICRAAGPNLILSPFFGCGVGNVTPPSSLPFLYVVTFMGPDTL